MDTPLQKFYDVLPTNLRKAVAGHNLLLDNATAEYLGEELDTYFKRVKAESSGNECLDLSMIERMVGTFKRLLQEFAALSEDEKTVVSLAIRYFIEEEDAQSDFSDPFGFDDDLAVLNAALLAIGRTDMIVVR